MPEPTDFHKNADVFSSDRHKLGTLKGVVLKRQDLTVTRIIIDVGFLRSGHSLWEGGLGLEYDRVIDVGAVASVSPVRVDLRITAADFKDAPEYTEELYEGPTDLTPNKFDLTDVVVRAEVLANAVASTPAVWLVERLNRQPDEVDIQEGTPVWRVEPHSKLGDVDRILVDASGAVVAVVVRRGVFLKRDVILPVRYITEFLDDFIHVGIGDTELEQLQEFHST